MSVRVPPPGENGVIWSVLASNGWYGDASIAIYKGRIEQIDAKDRKKVIKLAEVSSVDEPSSGNLYVHRRDGRKETFTFHHASDSHMCWEIVQRLLLDAATELAAE